ncbi:MAG: CAP domain-containing protein, partial [Patescibacteria group bacterium]
MKTKKTQRVRNKKRRTGKKSHVFSIVTVICLTLFLSLNFYFVKIKSINKFSPLPIPQLSRIYLPDLLIIPEIETSVLGAQDINPVDFINDINLERSKVGSPNLRINEKMMKAAQMRAETILKYQNFSHYDPFENLILATVLPKVNYHFT